MGNPRRSRDERSRPERIRDNILKALRSGPKTTGEFVTYHMTGIGNQSGAGGSLHVGEIREVLDNLISKGQVYRYESIARNGIRMTVYELITSVTESP